MKVDRKRIARLTAEGISPVNISQDLGITPSHLSQIMAEENFNIMVQEFQAVIELGESLEEHEARESLHKEMDTYWDEIEALSIEKLRDTLAMGLVTKPSEVLSIAAIANKALRKRGGSNRTSNADGGATILQLQISNVLVNKGEVTQTSRNRENQVIEVDGRTIINATKESIFTRLEGLRNEKLQLPSPTGISLADI